MKVVAAVAALGALVAAHPASKNPVNIHWSLNGGGPEQIWINYGADPSQMVANWVTVDNAPTVVQWGEESGTYTGKATGDTSSYTFGLYKSGIFHHATMSGLEAGKKYFYRVGDGASTWSSEYSFSSHPGVGPDVDTTWFVMGDLGQTTYSNQTVWHGKDAQSEYGAQQFFITGDLSYADSDEQRWDSWGRLMQPLSAYVPGMVAFGNHEVETQPITGKNFVPADTRFRMPYPKDSPGLNNFWSIEHGPVTFISMGSYIDFKAGSPQYNFIKSALAAVDRARTPFVVGIAHAPWYNTNTVHRTEGKAMLAVYEELFYGKVDMVFFGHVHAYERHFPCYQDKVDAKAPVYITVGDAGNREGLYDDWVTPTPACSAFRKAEYGHGLLQANATDLVWTWRRDSEPESVVSDSTVVKAKSD